jgi:hypothetical protein
MMITSLRRPGKPVSVCGMPGVSAVGVGQRFACGATVGSNRPPYQAPWS